MVREADGLCWYIGWVAVEGFTVAEAEAGMLNLRVHLRSLPALPTAKVWWVDDDQRLIVQTEVQGHDEAQARTTLTGLLHRVVQEAMGRPRQPLQITILTMEQVP